MINVYKKSEEGLVEVDLIEKDYWINAVQPNYLELNEINKIIDVPEEFLTDPLDIDERPRMEIENNHMLIILRIPFFDKEHSHSPYRIIPLGIIYSPSNIITISAIKTEILEIFINRRIKNFSPKNRERFILLILLKTATLYLKYLRQINNLTTDYETELHKSMKNQELVKLMDLEKSLVYFTTSLKANEIMIGRLSMSKQFQINSDNRDLLEDVMVEYKQAIEMAQVLGDILNRMMNSFASLISNNLNAVMKYLTSITIVLMLPTLVASIYGMNIKLPFQESPYAFLITMCFSLCLSCLGVVFIIKRKK